MADNFLHKQIGPFSGGVWIAVIGGGIGLAILIKKGIGGGGNQQGQPILVETVPLRKGGGATSDNDPSIPPKQDPRVPPPQQPPIKVPKPEAPKCPSGMVWSAAQNKCVPSGYTPRYPTPTPQPKPTPQPPPQPPQQKPRANVPGGFSTGCDGIGYFPPDYQQRMNMPTAKFQDRAIKLSWAVQNVAAGPSGIYAFTAYLSSPAVWPMVNVIRRRRGLRAMTETEFRSLITDLNGIIAQLGGKENHLSNAHIMSIWSKYNTPFVCANSPQHRDSRDMRRTGAP